MGLLTISSTASIDAFSGQRADVISGLTAGEELPALSVVRLDDDGKVYLAVTTEHQNYQTIAEAPDADDNSSVTIGKTDFLGIVPKKYLAGETVTIFGKGVKADYCTGMTPGKYLFCSATKGRLSDAVVLAGDDAVAMAINSTDIMVIK
jgi:hypothetical protein